MGKNKLQKFDDMRGYSHVHEYPFARIQSEGFPMKGSWGKECFGNDNPIVLELGCGRGEYAVQLGKLYPEKNFIGIDIKGARMWSGAKESHEAGLKNVAFLRTNIELIDHFFAAGEVAEVWITFPDPQMKKLRKRLTSTRFMELYQKIVRPNGLIHLKCDSNFLFTYTRLLVEKNNLVVHQLTEDLYHSGIVDKILSIQTAYEQQWIDRGLNIRYLQFELPQTKIEEPNVEIPFDEYRSYNRSRRSESTQSL